MIMTTNPFKNHESNSDKRSVYSAYSGIKNDLFLKNITLPHNIRFDTLYLVRKTAKDNNFREFKFEMEISSRVINQIKILPRVPDQLQGRVNLSIRLFDHFELFGFRRPKEAIHLRDALVSAKQLTYLIDLTHTKRLYFPIDTVVEAYTQHDLQTVQERMKSQFEYIMIENEQVLLLFLSIHKMYKEKGQDKIVKKSRKSMELCIMQTIDENDEDSIKKENFKMLQNMPISNILKKFKMIIEHFQMVSHF